MSITGLLHMSRVTAPVSPLVWTWRCVVVACCCVLLRLGTAVTMGRMLWDATVRIIWRPTAKCSVQHIAALPPPPSPPPAATINPISNRAVNGFSPIHNARRRPLRHSPFCVLKVNHQQMALRIIANWTTRQVWLCIVSWPNLNCERSSNCFPQGEEPSTGLLCALWHFVKSRWQL